MVLIQLYVIFAVATALTAWWGFFKPLLAEARDAGVKNALVESPVIAHCIFILVSFVLAPFIISALIFPMHGEYFRIGLQRVIQESDN